MHEPESRSALPPRLGGRLLGQGTFLLAAALSAAPASAQDCRYELEYGMNPSFHTWTSRAVVLADAMTRARTFLEFLAVPGQLVPGAEAELIPLGQSPPRLGEGWPNPAALLPGQRFGAFLFGSMDGTLPDGREQPYVVVWEGTGQCWLGGPFVVAELDRSEQRVEFVVDPTAGPPDAPLFVDWTSPDPADPVRDVRVWLPGMEGSGRLFWPPFLEKVRLMNVGRGPYSWRTLEWSRANECGKPPTQGGYALDLAGAITPASASQGTGRGMCPEYQVAFCNALRAHLHYPVPHRDSLSEDEYRSFLEDTLLRIRDGSPAVPGINGDRPFAGLAPGLTVTLELSNEMWNPGFPVHAWLEAEAARKGITFHAAIASELELVFDVARSVFSGPHAPLLRTFVGGWIADPGFAARVLAALPAEFQVDALGPAGYFAPRPDEIDAWLEGALGDLCPNCPGPDELLAAARGSIELLRPSIRRHRALADAHPNPDLSVPGLVLYEAGQGIQARFLPFAGAAMEAQYLPEMYAAYTAELVPLFVEEGVDLVHWYSFMTDQESGLVDPWGTWDDMLQTIPLPAIDPYVHAGAPKAAVICQGPPLSSGCIGAKAIFRNLGNPPAYTIARPILGRAARARVAVAQTGHSFATVLGSPARANRSLAVGTLLLEPGTIVTFLPLAPGPIALWNVAIPNDPALAGFKLMTQALLVGGAPAALTNAQDLRLGVE